MSSIPLPSRPDDIISMPNPLRLGQSLHCLWSHTVTKQPQNKQKHTCTRNKQTNMSSLPLPAGLMTLSVSPNPLRLGQPSIASDLTQSQNNQKTNKNIQETYKQTNKQTHKLKFNTSSSRPDDIISGSDPLRLGQPSIASDITVPKQPQNTQKHTRNIQTNKHTWVQYLFLQAWWHYQWVRSTEAWSALHCLWSHIESWWPLRPTSWGCAECGSAAGNYPQLENGNQNLCIFWKIPFNTQQINLNIHRR